MKVNASTQTYVVPAPDLHFDAGSETNANERIVTVIHSINHAFNEALTAVSKTLVRSVNDYRGAARLNVCVSDALGALQRDVVTQLTGLARCFPNSLESAKAPAGTPLARDQVEPRSAPLVARSESPIHSRVVSTSRNYTSQRAQRYAQQYSHLLATPGD